MNCLFQQIGSGKKLAVNMLAEIQPKKNTASRNFSRIFSQASRTFQVNLA